MNRTSSRVPVSRGIGSRDCKTLSDGSIIGYSAWPNRNTKSRRKKKFRSSAKAPSKSRPSRRDKVRAGLAVAGGSVAELIQIFGTFRRPQGFGVTGREGGPIILSYGFFVALAAISAIFFALRRSRLLDRHQPDEVSGRFLRKDALEDRQGVRGHARPGGGRNREPGREKNGGPLLASETGAGAQCGVARRYRKDKRADQEIRS